MKRPRLQMLAVLFLGACGCGGSDRPGAREVTPSRAHATTAPGADPGAGAATRPPRAIATH